ncbi:MAG: formylglycine-generating enzyme family protein [Methylomonas sp.]
MPTLAAPNSETPRSACGWADLLAALAMADGDAGRENRLAALLGFQRKPEEPPEKNDLSLTVHAESVQQQETSKPERTGQSHFHPYRLVSLDIVEASPAWRAEAQDTASYGVLTEKERGAWQADYPPPAPRPIVPWTRLWPRLRQLVAASHAAGVDVARLTADIANGRPIRSLPRRRRLVWPAPLTVVLDFSDRLTPYWDDWFLLRRRLEDSLHRQVRFYRLKGVPQQRLQAIRAGRPAEFTEWPGLAAGQQLLLVSDLGLADYQAHPWPSSCWRAKLAELRLQGIKVSVLAPISGRHQRADLLNNVSAVRLSPDSALRPLPRLMPHGGDIVQAQDWETLLSMMSVATRIEPALLRELRACLPVDGMDAGLEAEIWCFPELDTAATACALASWAVQPWREKFKKLPEALQQRTLACLRDYHARLPQAIHHEETLIWRHLAKEDIAAGEEGNAGRARDYFYKLANSLTDNQPIPEAVTELRKQLADRYLEWAAPVLNKTEPCFSKLLEAFSQTAPERVSLGLPPGVDPVAWLQSLPVQEPKKVCLRQHQDKRLSFESYTPLESAKTGEMIPLDEFMRFIKADAKYHSSANRMLFESFTLQQPSKQGEKKSFAEWMRLTKIGAVTKQGVTRLADLVLDRPALLCANETKDGLEDYQPYYWRNNSMVLPGLLTKGPEQAQSSPKLILHTGFLRFNFERFQPPEWASAWGQDRYGLYADLNVNNVIQRFRWIAPGVFQMGSPSSELERYDNETQHQVTLTQGYWLADSACSQALWMAVMRENPSRFQDEAGNPVERISWDDAQNFIEHLNGMFHELQARMPTEAEWEYACRAGTNTAFSCGENISTELVNYHCNYPYADGAKGQFRGKTVPVKSLPANDWGLHEMHGNVWEWCADWFGDYEQQAVVDYVEVSYWDQSYAYDVHAIVDPLGPVSGSARVVRGGSWSSVGGYVRSAIRFRFSPGFRDFYLGFRLALGQKGSAGKGKGGGQRPDRLPRRSGGGQAGRGSPAGKKKGRKN